MKLRLLALVMVIGCSSGSSGKTPDAAPVKMDAALAACTGLIYDSCNPASSNCGTGLTCKNYPMPSPGFNVCIPSTADCATAGCPTQNGTAVTCNGMGFCKPAAPNSDCSTP